MTETINHPPHYMAHPSGVEAIDICEWLPFSAGNAIKYVWRADHKGRSREDLHKAIWYLERQIRSRGPSMGPFSRFNVSYRPGKLASERALLVLRSDANSLLSKVLSALAVPEEVEIGHLEVALEFVLEALPG